MCGRGEDVSASHETRDASLAIRQEVRSRWDSRARLDRNLSLGAVFTDAEVARAYRHRAPHPDDVLTTLRRLLVVPDTVLDVGAGTGALARQMLAFASHVDAVDPSAAMIEEGRRLAGGTDPRLNWITGRAEDAPISPPCGLIAAGASLHWLDLDVVLPRLRDALAPDAVMAIAETEIVQGKYWADVEALIREHSETTHHTEAAEFIEVLRSTDRFAFHDLVRTKPVAFSQSIDQYIEALHSTSTLARVRLAGRSPRFDAEVRAVFERHGLDRVRFDVIGIVAWGRPT